MTLPIITADQRLAEKRGIKGNSFGALCVLSYWGQP
jgi:hypothetical protein